MINTVYLRRKHRPLSMHSTHGAFSRSIKFNVKSFISALTDRQYELRKPKELLTWNNPKERGPGRSRESFLRASLWCRTMTRRDRKSSLTICVI